MTQVESRDCADASDRRKRRELGGADTDAYTPVTGADRPRQRYQYDHAPEQCVRIKLLLLPVKNRAYHM
jgi:hypothetical protein